jgi:hypothetical protein
MKTPQMYTSFLCVGCEIISVPLEKEEDTDKRNPKSAIQCPTTNAITARIPVRYSSRRIALPAVSHHATKKGFNAEVIIPADTVPEKGFNAEVMIPEDMVPEQRLRLLAEIEISIVEASFAFMTIKSPKAIIIKPPAIARYEIIPCVRKDDAPTRISMKKMNSTRAWPINIEGPALQPL